MSKIITVTLNPTLDRTLFVHHLAEGYPNTVTDETRLDAAGRGVNISQALHTLEQNTHALVMLGTDAIGKAYRALIHEAPFQTHLIRRTGLTRSNTIIYDSGNKQETHIVEEGENFSEDADDTATIIEEVIALVDAGDTVVLSDALPRGIPVDIYAKLIESIKEADGNVVLSADGISLEIGLRSTPHIIAMRQNELESFFNFPVRTAEDVVFAARKLSERSDGSLVLVGAHDIAYGIIIDEAGEGCMAELPPLPDDHDGTMSGVEDAFLAGFLAHYATSNDPSASLGWALAAAAYTRSRPGNAFGTYDDVQRLYDAVNVQTLENQAKHD